MICKPALLPSLIGALFAFSVCSATTETQYPLEFITQEHVSVHAMTYGFQLLENIREIRMGCEERQDEQERQFTVELQNWMKYSQQTEQVIGRPEFQKYLTESKETVETNLHATYKEMYLSRSRRLNVLQQQCDDKVEDLLQQRKVDMLRVVVDLMTNDLDGLRQLVTELVRYRTELQDGYLECVAMQALHHKSGLSSKLMTPEELCSVPDITILTAFLNRMLTMIALEQTSFFGDDEDLTENMPCGSSGCGETDEPTDSEEMEVLTTATPPSKKPDTHPTTKPTDLPPSPTSHELPTRPTRPHTDDYTRPPPTTDTARDPPSSNSKQLPTEPDTKPTATTAQPDTKSTDGTPETKPPVTEPETHRQTQEPETKPPSSQPETEPPTTGTTVETTTQPTPGWLKEAFDTVLHRSDQPQEKPQLQAQAQAHATEEQVPVEQETVVAEEDSHSHHLHHHGHDGHHDGEEDSGDKSQSTGGSRTRGRHGGSHEVVIDIPEYDSQGDAEGQGSQGDSGHIYRPIIYSFAAVGGVLVAATLVLVMAILVVQRKRRQLLAAQLLTQEQKIAIMKQTGYVNPTYKFFDKHNDG